tara:strand:- start:1429 stop:1572 length:144 start_codon:yes stop_codon:yes gene_type:complete
MAEEKKKNFFQIFFEKWKWYIVGIISAILIAGGAFFMYKKKKLPPSA